MARRSKFKVASGSEDFGRDILHALDLAGEPLTSKELSKRLRVAKHQGRDFERALGELERSGALVQNRAGALLVAKRIDVVPGRIEGHPDGHGFLVPDDGSPHVFISPGEMKQAMHGDRAAVRIAGRDHRGRPQGSIVEVLERRTKRIVGRLHSERGVLFIVPEDRRIAHDIFIAPRDVGKAKPGQVVTVDLIAHPSRHAQPVGQVAEVLGNYADPGMEIEIAVRKFDLPHEFSKRAIAAARAMPEEVQVDSGDKRKDLRDLGFVTIDGETARDFDDAVFARREGKGWRLWVAIADVSHYVRPGDAIEHDARERGTSVYFPRRVIPMLPEKLSNGLCSLNPGVDRLAMVCEMAITPKGEVAGYEFYAAVFRSHARLTYTEVWTRISQKTAQENLVVLYDIFKVLHEQRTRRGAIDFETVETRMIFDPKGKIEKIVAEPRNDAHRLIEECMLAANVCAGDFIAKHEHPVLYRVHDVPAAEKVVALRDFLAELGLQLPGGEIPKPKDYAQLLEKIRKRPDFSLLQTTLLRSLKQAVYTPANVGHFGLAFDAYVHFTSPIRRYPDLLVHRVIKALLAKKTYAEPDWEALGRQCSEMERRADDASRDVETWLKCYYMRDEVGRVFDGVITGVTPFGVFVMLKDYYVDGLVHISELGRDYYRYEAARHMLLGERTGKRFRLADPMKVKLVRVDLESRKMDLVPA